MLELKQAVSLIDCNIEIDNLLNVCSESAKVDLFHENLPQKVGSRDFEDKNSRLALQG